MTTSAQSTSRRSENVRRLEQLCDEFEAIWRSGLRPALRDFLDQASADIHQELFVELLAVELAYRRRRGEHPCEDEYTQTQPDYADLVRQEFSIHQETQVVETGGSTIQRPIVRPCDQQSSRRIGDYELIEEIACGGMGVIFKARQLSLDRVVAVKLIRADESSSPEFIDRFLEEQRAVATLRHPGIVAIYDAGQIDGEYFYSMELIEGETLVRRTKVACPPDEAARIVSEAANAIQHAHEHGILHRDLKPSNLLLDRDGRVRITDFGLAKRTNKPSELTMLGQIVGTPNYMSPEQTLGDSAAVDARSDVYSLGAVLYTLLCGRPPHEGETVMATLTSVLQVAPKPLREWNPSIDAELEQICLKCLAKAPADRYSSSGELARSLQCWREKRPSSALPVLTPPTQSFLPLRSNKSQVKILAAGLLAIFLFGVLIRVSTDQGDLVIRADDPQVAVVIQQSGVMIRDDDGQRTYRLKVGSQPLKSGEYTIDVAEDSGLKLETTRFSIERRNKVVLKAWIEKKPEHTDSLAVEKPIVTPAARPDRSHDQLADRKNPFVVVRAKSNEKVETDTLALAIQRLQNGDIIEVYGNGPFSTGMIETLASSITIRAAPGFRPQFKVALQDHQAMLVVNNARLSIQGCDFRCPYMSVGSFFHGTGPVWEFHNCRFLGGIGEPLDFDGPRLQMSDCLISFNATFAGEPWLRLRSKKLEWVMDNCVVRSSSRELFPLLDDCDWKLRWTHNTVDHRGTFLTSLADRPRARIEIEAVDNIFQLNQIAENLYSEALVYTWGDRVQWRGHHNLYVGPKGSLVWVVDPNGPRKLFGLSGWNEVWKQDEAGSHDAEAFSPSMSQLDLASEPDSLLSAVQKVLLTYRHEFSTNAEDAGPNCELIGPGKAYVRALQANGQPEREGALSRKSVSGAPFVVLRNGKAVQAFDQLALAFAAVQDGDILELYTDQAVPTASLPTPEKPMRLTIRAAPGYLPTIEGPAPWLVPGITLSVEGLHFRRGNLTLGDDSQTGKNGRLARLANCSFSANFVSHGNFVYSVGSPWAFAQLQTNNVTEIVNCLGVGAIAICAEPSHKLVIRNSIVRSLVQTYSIGTGEHTVEIDHSLLRSPVTRIPALIGFDTDHTGPFASLRMTMRHSIVENPASLFEFRNSQLKLLSWQGQGNIFAIGEGYWSTTYQAQTPVVTGLQGWRTLWGSDQSSTQRDPVAYDATSWKLLPNTPGFRQGSDGRDLGADVAQIGFTTAR